MNVIQRGVRLAIFFRPALRLGARRRRKRSSVHRTEGVSQINIVLVVDDVLMNVDRVGPTCENVLKQVASVLDDVAVLVHIAVK